jgi:hypothetical protein
MFVDVCHWKFDSCRDGITILEHDCAAPAIAIRFGWTSLERRLDCTFTGLAGVSF